MKEPKKNGKICIRCDKELTGRKLKYCDDSCEYWYHACRRTTKGWGSKNSQMRLNKRTARFGQYSRFRNKVQTHLE